MARLKEKEQAISLRKQGQSYSQIKSALGVGKGTLSVWLRDFPLSEKRIRELRDWNHARIERYGETRRRTREERLEKIYASEKKQILPFSKRELYLCGLFLYWGEGGKTQLWTLSLSNTDPSVIKAFLFWLERCLDVKRKEVGVRLHLYKDMDIETEIKFWIKTLGISRSQFKKPYIKKTNRAGLTHRNGFGHGTCNIVINRGNLARRVFMGIKAISDFFVKSGQ